MDELETERNLKLKAEDRSAALQQRANQDAEVIARLRRERDELRQTAKRLHSECGTVCVEHNQAVRERDEARQGVSSLRADLRAMVARRLEAKSVFAGLGMEVVEVRGIL